MKVLLTPLYPWTGPQSITEDGVKTLRTLPTFCANGEGPIELAQRGIYTFGRMFLSPPCMDASASHFAIHIPKDGDITSSSYSIQIERVSDKSFVVIEINGSSSNIVKLTTKGQKHILNVGDVIRWPNYRLRVESVQANGSLDIPTPRGVTFTPLEDIEMKASEAPSASTFSAPKRPRVDNASLSLENKLLPTHRPIRRHLLLLPLLSVGQDCSASVEESTTQLLSVLTNPSATTCSSGRAATSLSLSLFVEVLHIVVVVSREQFNSDRRLQQQRVSELSTATIICGDLIRPFSDESTRQALARSCGGLDSRDIIKEGGISALVCRSNRRYLCERAFDQLTNELFTEAKGEIPRPSTTSGKHVRSSSSSSSSSSQQQIAPICTARVVSCSVHSETSTSYVHTQGISHVIYSVCPSFSPNRPNTPTVNELARGNILSLLRDSYSNTIQAAFDEIATLADRSREVSQVDADDSKASPSALNGSSSAVSTRPAILQTRIPSTNNTTSALTQPALAVPPIHPHPLAPPLFVPPPAPLPLGPAAPPPPSSSSTSVLPSTTPSTTSNKTFALWETPDDTCFHPNSRSALFEYAKNPSNFRRIIRYEDENCVIVSDRYPKARLHFLLLAKPAYLNNVLRLTDLKQRDVAKLEVLYQTARAFATNAADDFYTFCRSGGDGGGFGRGGGGPLIMNIGLHMIPSLEPLHIHIISDDFCSLWVKTKRHFNSFASDFFYKLDELVQSLREIGDLAAEINSRMAQRQLDKDLKCTKCGLFGGGTMAEFKLHLESHIR